MTRDELRARAQIAWNTVLAEPEDLDGRRFVAAVEEVAGELADSAEHAEEALRALAGLLGAPYQQGDYSPVIAAAARHPETPE